MKIQGSVAMTLTSTSKVLVWLLRRYPSRFRTTPPLPDHVTAGELEHWAGKWEFAPPLGATSHGRWSHSDAASYVLYGLMKYIQRRPNGRLLPMARCDSRDADRGVSALLSAGGLQV
jgi:hypothetical protein